MSKKKFIDGLESIFKQPKESFTAGNTFLADTKEDIVVAPPPRKTLGKNFTSDLDSLLDEVFAAPSTFQDFQEDSPENVAEEKKRAIKRKMTKPVSGLDILIRQTTSQETTTVEYDYGGKQRVTFIFDQRKLDKLKKLARKENLYLKDFITNIIEDYIKEK